MSVELLPATPALLEAALREGWLVDPPTNREMGYGSDPEGLDRAAHDFLAHLDNGLVAIYHDRRPVGWLSLEDDGDGSVLLSLFVAPKSRRQGVGSEAVRQAARAAIEDDGCRRVGAKVPEINKPAREFFLSFGFRKEGKSWGALRFDGKDYDTVNLVLTEAEWKRVRDHGEQE